MRRPPAPPSGTKALKPLPAMNHAHALPAGTVIEGYRIERLLGEGGFGLTYYAIETAIDRPVAIKEYLPIGIGARDHKSLSVMPVSEERGKDFEWGLERFRKEAATLVQFEHPNIVAIHRFFEALGTAYLVMPFIEGVSLEDIIKKTDHVPEAELRVIIDPLLDGLEGIHKADYVHRDIKPANIVMRHDGSPVLIDFGAARRFRNTNTVAMTSILTEGFAPIEQYQPDSEQGPWTDVYALGAVLYMCVTGMRPMSATTRAEAMAMNRPDPMDSAADASIGAYSPALLGAIDAALRLSRDERPQTMGELRAMLDGSAPTGTATHEKAVASGKAAGRRASGYPVGPDGARLPPVQTPPAAPKPAADTLSLGSRVARRSRGFGSPWMVAVSALLVVAMAGAGYAAWRFNAGDAPTTAAADTDADTTASAILARAQRSLAAAKMALGRGDITKARREMAAAVRHVRSAADAKPGLQRTKALAIEIAGFRQALARAREQQISAAETALKTAERDGAAATDIARLEARLTAARNIPEDSQVVGAPSKQEGGPDPNPIVGDLPIVLEARGLTWIHLIDAKGATVIMGAKEKGWRFTLPDEPGMRLTVGRANELVIMVGGRALPPLHTDAVPVHNVALDAVKLRQKAEALGQ